MKIIFKQNNLWKKLPKQSKNKQNCIIKKYAVLDASDFNVPQTRKRVILIGVNKKYFKNKDIQKELLKFYTKIHLKRKVLKSFT